MTGGTEPLLVRRENAIVHLRFNRPAVLNAIDIDTANAFLDACRALTRDSSVRVVVMSGAGRAFLSGGDLQLFRKDPVETAAALIDPIHGGVALLATLGAPVLASLHGVVAGVLRQAACAARRPVAVRHQEARSNIP